MRKTALGTDRELDRMLSPEQRRVVRLGSRAQREEEAPAPKASREALKVEFDEEREGMHREADRRLIMELIADINSEYGVGGGNMDLRKGSALNAR